MTEWLTIFDTEKNILGKKLRDEVHRDGDWLRNISLLVCRER